jgi:predicted Zn-dependent protease with MMP-like domain
MPRRPLPAKDSSPGKRFFEQTVKEVVDSLPPELKDRLENVAFFVEENSSSVPEEWEDKGGDLLGLYHGISKKDRGFWYGNVLPDRIIIYRKPLERISSSLQELRENIRQTVIHEIGHYFGFDEEELRSLEEEEF